MTFACRAQSVLEAVETLATSPIKQVWIQLRYQWSRARGRPPRSLPASSPPLAGLRTASFSEPPHPGSHACLQQCPCIVWLLFTVSGQYAPSTVLRDDVAAWPRRFKMSFRLTGRNLGAYPAHIFGHTCSFNSSWAGYSSASVWSLSFWCQCWSLPPALWSLALRDLWALLCLADA